MLESDAMENRLRGDEHVEVAEWRDAEIWADEIERSIGFYRRLLGLHVVEDASRQAQPRVVMSTAEGGRLTIRTDRGGGRPAAPHRSTFAVDDLDRVREILWNRGVHIARRSVVVRDPDGHEIELVEVARATWIDGVGS
jgi:catechol 2,3-dioxygenase-like lactoylglutathione lyase family enzyme